MNKFHLFIMISTVFFTGTSITELSHAQLGPKDGHELTPKDLDRVKVGQPAPDFTLEGIDGKKISLSSYRSQKNVVLVFFRGHWWPYCVSQLGELSKLVTKDQRHTVQVLAISLDSHEDSKQSQKTIQNQYSGNLELSFLQDKDHKVIDRYGLLYSKNWGGLPNPATYVIDRKGILRGRFIELNYRTRPSNQQIHAVLKKLM